MKRPKICEKRGCYLRPKSDWPIWDSKNEQCPGCPYGKKLSDIGPHKSTAIAIEHDDPTYTKGVNVTFISLNEVEYIKGDRWIQVKGNTP